MLGATCRRFLLSEEGEVISEQLELGALLESTLPRLCLVIYFGEFLQRKPVSARKQKYKFDKRGSALAQRDDDATTLLTTTKDFFTPNTASLARMASPSGYSAVVSLWKPGALIIMCR